MLASKFKCIVKTLQGLENTLSSEMKTTLGVETEILKRAVSFEADLALLYKANLELRTALSIIIPILEFEADNVNTLYNKTLEYAWEDLILPSNTISVHATSYSVYFNHSQYAALKVKDAIVDRIRKNTGKRPDVNTEKPDFEFNVHIKNKSVTLSLNSSGETLNKRNYRHKQGIAPLNETLAAAMLIMAGYTGKQAFYDFMSGSGTLAIEAGLIATETPPGAFRKDFGFFHWPNFDKKLWQEIVQKANSKRHKPLKSIWASDQSPVAISEASTNIYAAGLSDFITLSKQKFEKIETPSEPGLIVMNLPYDIRVEINEAEEFYKTVSDVLKNNFKQFNAWVLAPKSKSFKSFALKPVRKINLLNASIECSFNNYDLY